MLRIGLTGGIGSGKSVIARLFGVLGIPVFPADERARALMEGDPAVRKAIEARFGPGVFGPAGLDRSGLAQLVFADRQALDDLNAIVHPAVRRAFTDWSAQQKVPYVIMEAAIMAENEGYRSFDRVITVSCSEEVRIQRVMERDGSSRESVLARMRSQAGEEERQRIAHFTVCNDGATLVIPQVLRIHEQLSATIEL